MHEPFRVMGAESQLKLPSTLESLSAAAVDSCSFGSGFVRPAYENFCFSRLPGFFEHTLLGSTERGALPKEVLATTGHYDHVIFVFIDAFGWRSFERFRDSSLFLREIDRHGTVLKTTSQFPSTTVTHVTTGFTGLAAYEHEICGFDYYEPRLGRMIRPLRFAFSDEGPDSLRTSGLPAVEILPQSLMIPNLQENDVSLRFLGPASFFPSSFNSSYASGSLLAGFDCFARGIESAKELAAARPFKSFQSLYIDRYDSTCHAVGVGAPLSDKVALDILKDLERFLRWNGLPRTLLVVSADHGHMGVDPACCLAVNTHIVPDLASMLQRDVRGVPIRFSGGLRHLFLHPKPECYDYLLATLREKLAGAATVLSIPEAASAGLLGPNDVKESYKARLGSIGILPHAGYAVLWDEPTLFKNTDVSAHGGASPDEMETPLLLLPLG